MKAVKSTVKTPEGRTSLCYDRAALDARKEHKPKTSALEMAAAMDAEVLTQENQTRSGSAPADGFFSETA